MDGELEQVGTQWRLRFTRSLRHPVERVWQALADPDDLPPGSPTASAASGGSARR